MQLRGESRAKSVQNSVINTKNWRVDHSAIPKILNEVQKELDREILCYLVAGLWNQRSHADKHEGFSSLTLLAELQPAFLGSNCNLPTGNYVITTCSLAQNMNTRSQV